MAEPFRLPRIKVCGVRAIADAVTVVAAGGDAIGLVRHAPSPRHLEPIQAGLIVAAVPSRVLAVLVAVDAEPAELERAAQLAGAGAVQLCGSERAQDWRWFALPILRRIAVEPGAELELERWSAIASGFVLDHPAAAGGTGQGVDLDLAARLAARAPCILAGGLDASNVALAVERVRPAGVDASSRLESTPGLKDPARIEAFVRAARAALEEVAA
jgi:phosphoribosylanthranilate isomerase